MIDRCQEYRDRNKDKPLLSDRDTQWIGLYRLGGVATLILLAYSLVRMTSLMLLGGLSETVHEGFAMLAENRLASHLRLDVLTILPMPLQTSTLILSAMMLCSAGFGDVTAWVRVARRGLDLPHIVAGAFVPAVGVALLMVAWPLYLVWYPMLARDFSRLAKGQE